MVYISPTGSFDNDRVHPSRNDAGPLIKVQFENSLQLGWKLEDILLFTNFDFQYGHLKARVLKDVEFFEPHPQATKINAIVKLFEKALIKRNELYWFHDLDAFQLQKITTSELKLGKADIGLTDYGRLPRWNTGTMFFKKSARDIFHRIKEVMYKEAIDEEKALYQITEHDKSIRKRIKKIDKTYNFTPFNLKSCYRQAKKPITIVHFHPLGVIRQLGVNKGLEYYLGQNELGIPLITKRLVNIFRYHRIR